jgi:hypothetical protein
MRLRDAKYKRRFVRAAKEGPQAVFAGRVRMADRGVQHAMRIQFSGTSGVCCQQLGQGPAVVQLLEIQHHGF